MSEKIQVIRDSTEFMPTYGSLPKILELSERKFQTHFFHNLREKGWIIFKEERSLSNKHRIDAVITRKDVGYYIGAEFKVPDHFEEITKGLRQLIDYTKDKFTHQPILYALLTPKRLNEESIRFFWRWGFGVSSYDPYREIIFVNGENKNTIYLDSPEISKPWKRNTPEKTAELAERMNKYW